MRELETLGARSSYQPIAFRAIEKKSTYMLDAHAERAVPIAPLSEETRAKVFAFFDRKMSSSYRNGCKAGLAEGSAKRNSPSVVGTERA